MRKPLVIAVAVAAIALAVAAAWLWQRNQQLTANLDDTVKSRDATQSQYSDAIGAIAEIQDSLAAIGMREASGPVLPGSPAAEQGGSAQRGREALDRIAMLKAGIAWTKNRIQTLETRLKASNVHVAGLQRMVEDLKHTVNDREAQLAVLSAQVDSLHTQVNTLATVVSTDRDSIQAQSTTIENQRQDLSRVYCVIGSKSELVKAGVVKASGGVLGLGKTLEPTADSPVTAFRTIDTDAEQVVDIPAPKARVLSAQPLTSYTLIPSGNHMELHITDAHEFRTIKRVVILTQS